MIMDECLNGEVFAPSREQESQSNSAALTSRLKDTCHDSFTGPGTADLSHESDSNQSNDQHAVKLRYPTKIGLHYQTGHQKILI